jgi:hypothetical protein
MVGLGVVYFGYGVGTDSLKKNAAVEPSPGAQPERKRPIQTMNMALGDMVFFARDLGFAVTDAKQGDLDPNKIAARIEGQLQEIRDLYRQEGVKNPALAGAITLQLNIAPSGEVSQVRELSSRFNDSGFEHVVAAAAAKWSFDIAEDHWQVICPLLFVHHGMDITTLVQWEKSLAQAGENTTLARPSGNAAPMQPAAAAPGRLAGSSLDPQRCDGLHSQRIRCRRRSRAQLTCRLFIQTSSPWRTLLAATIDQNCDAQRVRRPRQVVVDGCHG